MNFYKCMKSHLETDGLLYEAKQNPQLWGCINNQIIVLLYRSNLFPCWRWKLQQASAVWKTSLLLNKAIKPLFSTNVCCDCQFESFILKIQCICNDIRVLKLCYISYQTWTACLHVILKIVHISVPSVLPFYMLVLKNPTNWRKMLFLPHVIHKQW